MNNLEKDIIQEAQRGVAEAIKINLTGYSSPFQKLISQVIDDHSAELKKILDESFTIIISAEDFKQAVRDAFTHKIAKTLVSKLEGAVEKRLNELRADPIIKAKMVLAIEKIVEETGG